MNLYVSWFDWQRTTTGLEWASLVGNTGRISSDVAVGATSLTVTPALTVAISQWDIITIFDGSSSETVVATASAAVGATSITVAPTAFAHNSGTCYCTDGTGGSLADQIAKASTWLETICKQPLFLTTYTNETLAMPTMRASIDNHAGLHFRPRHWPVQSLTSLSITVVPGYTTAYDPTQVIIDSDKQMCTMPNMQPLPLAGSGQAPYPIWNVMSRQQSAQLTLTYSAGYSTVPADVAEAAVLLTSDILAKRFNPMGAYEMQMGKRSFSIGSRADMSGESVYLKRAKDILQNYSSSEAF
jgi:hypothetical protein